MRAVLWNAKDGAVVRELQNHSRPVTCVDVSKDGRFLATTCSYRGLTVFSAETGEPLLRHPGVTSAINRVAFSSDSSAVSSCSFDKAWVIDIASQEILWQQPTHQPGCQGGVASPQHRSVNRQGTKRLVADMVNDAAHDTVRTNGVVLRLEYEA
jgi:WD40 repeat protein